MFSKPIGGFELKSSFESVIFKYLIGIGGKYSSSSNNFKTFPISIYSFTTIGAQFLTNLRCDIKLINIYD